VPGQFATPPEKDPPSHVVAGLGDVELPAVHAPPMK
jgi:hypothetical protein